MPRKFRRESADDSFWRRERLSHKFDGVEKGSFAARSGKPRPAKSVRYLAEVGERFQARIVRKLSSSYYAFAEAMEKKADIKARLDETASSPNSSFQEILRGYIELDSMHVQKLDAERQYLELTIREMLKGNVPWKKGIEDRVLAIPEEKDLALSGIKELKSILKRTSEKALRQYEEVRWLLKNDPEYLKLVDAAKVYRAALKRVDWFIRADAMKERMLLGMKLLDPKQLKKNAMLRGYRITQLAINADEADIKVLDRYLQYLRAQDYSRFKELIKTVLSIRSHKQKNIEQNREYLKKYGAWWHRKKE